MPIELNCQSCGQTLRVADSHAGKRARCPKCQHVNQVPQPTSAFAENMPQPILPQPTSFPVASPVSETWELKLEGGQIYGPVGKEELNHWYEEGRISPRSQLRSSRTNQWIWAGELYGALGIPLPITTSAAPATPVNMFGDQPQINPNPYASPQGTSPYNFNPARSWLTPHRGAMVLILGICGIMICGLISPFAVILGHQDLGEMRAGRMDPEGRGLTIAEVVLGWIVTVPMLIGLLFIFIAIIAGLAH